MGGVQRTYYQNQRAAEISTIEHEYALFRKKYDKLAATVSGLSKRVSDAEKLVEKSNNKLIVAEGKLKAAEKRVEELEAKEKKVIPENIHITTLENKYNQLIGKVVAAKNKIIALNMSTPYRPGSVERTLRDVLEDIGNVSVN
jgi:hypothetical protein